MKIKALGKALAFRNKYLTAFIVLLLTHFAASSQFIGILNQHTGAGDTYLRLGADSTIYIPKFCGTPRLAWKDSTRPAIAYDSCNEKFYTYSPKSKSWKEVSGISSLIRDQISPGDTCIIIDSLDVHEFQIRLNPYCMGTGGGGGGSYSAGYGLNLSGSTFKADTTNGKLLYSKYQGKTALCFGDSYTYLRTYQAYLKWGLGVDTLSNGVSGSTITGVSSGTVSFVSRIDAALATDPDILVIVTGGNDWSTSKPIGNYYTTDTTTFIGACRYIAAACAAKSYAIKVIAVTPIQRGADRANYDAQKQYVDAMMWVFGSYGIPVIDAFTFSGINFENNGVYTSDGIHLNAAGQKKYGDFLVQSILANSSRGSLLAADGGFNGYCGFRALASITTGANNNATGAYSLSSTTTGSYNTGAGNQSLLNNTTGSHNTAAGHQALVNNTTGSYNSAFGRLALASNTTADYNTAFGYHSLYANTTGFHNTGIGTNVLESNTTGIQNSGFGMLALGLNTTGQQNSALGFNSLGSNTTGSYNASFGRTAMYSNTTGANNTAIGYAAGYSSTGSSNVFIGYNAGYYETGSNKLHIGNTTSRSLINGDFSTNNVNFSPLKMTTPAITGSGSGGSLPAGNYYYVITAVMGSDESEKSTEVGYAASGSSSSISITWTAVKYATGYKIYRGSSSGTYTAYFSQVGTTYTETGGSGTAGSPSNAGNAYYVKINASSDSVLKVNGSATVNGTFNLKGDFYVHGASDTTLKVTDNEVSLKSNTALRVFWATDDPYFEAVGGDVYLGIKSTARFHVNENLVDYTSSTGDQYLYLDKSADDFFIKQHQQGQFGKRLEINAGRVKLGDVEALNQGGVIDIYPRDKEIYLKTASDGTGSVYMYSDGVTGKSNGSVLGLVDNTTGKIGYLSSLSLNTTGSAASLTTSRSINGVSFNGTADITVPAAAGTLTGSSLASGVTSSSLTSFGTSIALGTPASGNFSSGTFTWPTFNQNTTGSAASLTTARKINGVSFNGTADIAVDKRILAYQALGSTIVAENVDGQLAQVINTLAMTSQRAYFSAVYIDKDQTITGVKWKQATAGSYTANNYNGVGLYSYSGGTLTLVASSTNDGNIWTATSGTVGSKAFSSTYSASAGLYFVAIIWSASATTTAPFLGTLTATSSINTITDFTNSAKTSGLISSLTALPSPTQASSGITASANEFWIGLY